MSAISSVTTTTAAATAATTMVASSSASAASLMNTVVNAAFVSSRLSSSSSAVVKPALLQPPAVAVTTPLLFGVKDPSSSIGASSSSTPLPLTSDVVVIPENKSLKHKLKLVSGSDDASKQRSRRKRSRPIVIGHRGCLYEELENTREGFQKCALMMGCDGIELDVFLLKCGTLVVFHGGGTDENPGDLLDYCGITGNILDLTYEQCQKSLQFNPNYDEFPCTKTKILNGCIPTLQEVLQDAKISGLKHIKIELKGPNTVEPTLELVDKLNMVEVCSFSSFDQERLALLRKLRPQKDAESGQHIYRTGLLFDELPTNYIQIAKQLEVDEIHLRYDTCTPTIVDEIHKEGYSSMCWFRGPIGMLSDCTHKYWDVGNEDSTMYETILMTGVQQICCNKPNVLLDYLKTNTKQQQEVDEEEPLRQVLVTDDDDDDLEEEEPTSTFFAV